MKNHIRVGGLSAIFAVALLCIGFSFGCGKGDVVENTKLRVLYTTPGGKINTLDPALSADLTSANMVGELYDTLLEYDYTARPYKLKPSMLAEMPTASQNMKTYEFKLRDDLFFQPDTCFGTKTDGSLKSRKITSKDVVFSILRIGDARIHSSGYWLIRGKIVGIGDFREKSAKLADGDFSVYDTGCAGLEVIDDSRFAIHLAKPDPRFLYALAMPYMSVVPREAVEKYGVDFAEHPVGSGPFKLDFWRRNYRIEFSRNPRYREEFFPSAANPADRKRPLPLLDKVVCYQIAEPVTAWMLFLQGNLDISSVSKDNFDSILTKDKTLVPALVSRGIELTSIPSFQIHYYGFCFTDPLIGKNLKLRKAVSLAYDVEKRVKLFNNGIIPASGPIPPGVAGYDPELKNPYAKYDLEKAKKLLAEAGYPNGMSKKTGKRLSLTLDFGGTSTTHRQLAELFVDDMEKIGIKIVPMLNNWPRFLQKSAKGEMQIFSVSWVGDYPDAENFLQLFYGPNAGSCNRSYYSDKTFDKMFEAIKTMPDAPARTARYKEMAKYLVSRCPWIFSNYPVNYRLNHNWLENYVPHNFCFSRWKYLSLDPERRRETKKSFKPLNFSELRK
ncbi:MAG: hypothetical protein GXP32_04115 [Kiritimatiellaeota bacterium]|nr:hypothetical protein [Kiritimatiellota bacterium]